MADLIFVGAVSAPHAGPDIAAQTACTLARLDEQLRSHQSSLASALSITVYLCRAGDFAAMNDGYRQAFTTAPPARTTVVTGMAPGGALVAMSAVGVPVGAPRETVHPPGWLLSPNPYSYAVRSGPYLYISGLLSRSGRDNSVVKGDVADQTRTILRNAHDILAAAGLSLADICSARVYLTDMASFQAMNGAYGEHFRATPPVRATGGVGLTSASYSVEIAFVACGAARMSVNADVPRHPNVSPAIVSANALFVAALLAEDAACGEPAAETRDILRQLDRVLATSGFRRDEIREVLLYAASERAGEVASSLCRDVIGAPAALTVAVADIGRPRATVELAATALRG